MTMFMIASLNAMRCPRSLTSFALNLALFPRIFELLRYYSNITSDLEITVWFNDLNKSQIDTRVDKIDRVKELYTQSFVSSLNGVNVRFFKEDFQKIHLEAIQFFKRLNKAKALFFIDP